MTSEIKEKMDCLEEDVGVEEDEEDIEEEEEDEEEEGDESVTHGRRSGRGLTLKTLLKEKILLPGLGNLSINYLGNIFKGDLMSDGRIRSQETGKIFGTPSAWAIFCKQIVNPNKKSGCGWASVKYRGKKLDEYKNNWNRQKRLEFEREGDDIECDDDAASCSESDGSDPFDHEVIEFDMLHTRHDAPYTGNPLIELSSFASLGRLQPFTVAASSSAMAVVDLHVHITRGEAVGFLAGQWDVNNHNLIVSHAFPLCWENPHSNCSNNTNNNSSSPNMVAGQAAEEAIHKQMASLKLALVGWYHSHPHSAPLPSLRDVDCQLDYEMKMKGSNDASYTPCIGFIVSPFHEPKNSVRRNSSVVPQPPNTKTEDADQTSADGEKNTDKKDNKTATLLEADVKGGDSIMTASVKEPMKTEAPPHSVPLKIDTSVIPVPTIPPHLKTLTPMNCYWVMPPPEHRPHEYPRPMSVIYNVVQDAFVPKEALIHMRECVKFYSNSDDGIDLHTTYDSSGTTYWDKLKGSIKARVPRDHYVPLIEYLHKILRIKLPLPELSQPLSPLPVKEEKVEVGGSAVCKGKEQIKTDIVTASNSPINSRSPHPASVNQMTEPRGRSYPDPSKIHPLLVDKSDERTLQPLILPSKSLPSDKTDENKAVHIHQILTDQLDGKSSSSDKLTDASSTSIQQTANPQNPPDYPFPLLRGMVAEQTSSVQRQQEQRVEKQTGEKEGDKAPEERHTVSITMTEKPPPRERGSPPPYSTLPPYPSFPSDLSKKEQKKSEDSVGTFSALGLLSSTSSNKSNASSDVITPSLSSSPLSLPFYAPQSGAITPQPPMLPPSPAPSVEVSPRHTEWAQNALSGMSRPPIISVKSQASLLNPPTTTTPPSPVLTSTTPGNDIHPTVPSMASLTESLTSSAANPWLQASFPGLAQFQAFNPSQFGKASAAEQSAAAAAFSAYHAASLLQQQSTGSAAEQFLLQHQQEQQRKQ